MDRIETTLTSTIDPDAVRHLAAQEALSQPAASVDELNPYVPGTWMHDEFTSAAQYARDEAAKPSLADGVDPCPYCGARWSAHR